MTISDQQFELILQTLLDAYDKPGLRKMLRIEMGVDLDREIGDGSLNEIVFNLISWAERTGRVHELIIAAQKGNPTNHELETLAEECEDWFDDDGASFNAQPTSDGEKRDVRIIVAVISAVAVIVAALIGKSWQPLFIGLLTICLNE
jgi:hypothetical protein